MGVARVTRGAASMLLLTGLLLLCLGDTVNAYSKYGRGCGDIGCLPNEECVITSDSCSYNQRDGKDCGNYPTCKRKSGAGGSTQTSSVNPSGSSLNTGPENNIFAPASSNPTLNTYTYFNHNNNNNNQQQQQQQELQQNNPNAGNTNHHNNHNNNNGNGNGRISLTSHSSSNNGNGGLSGVGGGSNGGSSASSSAAAAGAGAAAAGVSSTGIDPHYVFGAKHHMPVIPNMPIFPYNSPTQAPSFQQFPQPNHPGSVLNPGYPMHGLQPVNPYNPPFVFGQLPFYGAPGGTGGPPGGSAGILGGSGGGLAPYGSNYQGYQNPNMYNKPPPQYQNQNQQNPYNRQTQAHPSGAARLQGRGSAIFTMVSALLTTLLASTLRST